MRDFGYSPGVINPSGGSPLEGFPMLAWLTGDYQHVQASPRITDALTADAVTVKHHQVIAPKRAVGGRGTQGTGCGRVCDRSGTFRRAYRDGPHVP